LPADRKRPWNVKAATARMGARPGAFMREAVGQSQPRRSGKMAHNGLWRRPNCHIPEPVTQAQP
jgi:hypothetical protein